MAKPALRILIPALIAEPNDAARLSATLAGLPPGLDAVAQPLVQASLPGFDPERDPLLRAWRPPGPGAGGPAPWGCAPAALDVRAAPLDRSVPFPDAPAAPSPPDAPFPDAPRSPSPPGAPFADAAPAHALPDRPAMAVEPLYLGAPQGKWAALREGLARSGPAAWIAVVDGDDAYDLTVLPALLWRAEDGEGELLQGARRAILLDASPEGARRAALEPVVNELLRLRLAARGVRLAPDVTDLQSGLLLARRELLERFFAQPRMDGAPPEEAPGPLAWGSYGGELHLHAFVALTGGRARAHPVRARSGRSSGQTPADIGRQLSASTLFAQVRRDELEAAIIAAGALSGWGGREFEAARMAAREAFPASL